MQVTEHRKRTRGSGFTLVELMIVVAIIGILAAIAIPGFGRYVKKSRTAEASSHMNKMWSGSVAYFEADHADSAGTLRPKQFPGPTGPQEPTCCGPNGDKCPGSASEYSNAVWIALQFSLPDPHNFRPLYDSTGTGNAAAFTARVNGDLDCDATLSTFQRQGRVNVASGDVETTAAPFIDKPIE